MKKSWLLVCLLNFLIAALMGLLLRLVYIWPFELNYQYLIHAHSHTAMLGWAYMMIFSLFVRHFVPEDKITKYGTIFWLTQTTVIGMMISFPLQGYALFSITFSTLHIFCSYYFFYRIIKDVQPERTPAFYMLKASLLFMAVSTLGAWCLGATGATGGKNSPLYYSSLQFFLHFQFNGWLIFAVLALFFKYLERKSITINFTPFRNFYSTLIISTIFTLALPLSWYYPFPAMGYLNITGIAFQVAALLLFVKMLWPFKNIYFQTSSINRVLLLLPLFSLLFKMGIQAITIFPEIAVASHTVRNFTIGFIHLAMLGIISGFLLFFIKQNNRFFISGIILFYIGFIATEILLFIQGLKNFFVQSPVAGYYYLLFFFSATLPMGLMLIMFSQFKREENRVN